MLDPRFCMRPSWGLQGAARGFPTMFSFASGTVFAPILAKLVLPKFQSDLADPDLKALIDADKLGVHGYFKDFEKHALAAGVGKYNALNLPPPEVVLGRWGGVRAQIDVPRRKPNTSDISVAERHPRRMLGWLSCVCERLCG